MNILIVEPFSEKGHLNSNRYFVGILNSISNITVAMLSDYVHNFNIEEKIVIPKKLLNVSSALKFRISQIRILNYIRKQVDLSQFDLIFFLCYDELSVAISWPKNIRTIIFDHNNLDNVNRSCLKRLFYRKIHKNIVHLSYMDYISRHIEETYKRKSITISHPYYKQDTGVEKKIVSDSKKKIIKIFSPSAGTAIEVIRDLISFIDKHSGRFLLVAKSQENSKTDYIELEKFFPDYEERMLNSDFVFFGGNYSYRVSGVVFEALSLGVPVIIMNCKFARELKKEYPASIHIINTFDEIENIRVQLERIEEESKRFLSEHSWITIQDEMKAALEFALN